MADEPDLSPVREALAMAGFHDGCVQSHVMQAGILLSAFEGKIADDEVPLLPPGHPAWLKQAREVLSMAEDQCAQLKVQILAAGLRILEQMPPDDPDLALSINLDIVVSRHRATPRGTP